MGMHHGIVAADASADLLVVALNAQHPTIAPGPGRGSFDDLNLEDTDDGWHMAFGEHAGRSYVLDTSMVLSAAGDAVVAASRELGGVVVGCGEETTSGSYWLFAADNGRLLRGYWNCYTDMTEPWSKGEPLASEASEPIEHLDGAGLMTALESLGFDYDAWAGGTDLRELIYNPSYDESPVERGALRDEIEEFRKSVEFPEGKQPKPTVIRREGGFDLAAASPSGKKKGGLFGFLRRG
jgi:hypothetical protein